VKHVWEMPVRALAGYFDDEEGAGDENTLSPLTEGYAVTGDHNIVQVVMVARYRVRSPGEWAFYGPKADDVLRAEVTSAMVRSLGEMGVDRVLADGRRDLIATATRRAQAGLDTAHSGLELASLELTSLAPPAALAKDFDAVQSAFIGAETMKKDAQAFAEGAIPQAHAKADAAVQTARSAADSELALSRGSAEAFHALEQEYRTSRAVVRERLYRDAVERALNQAGKVRWVPPPIGGSYHGFRIELNTGSAGVRGTTNPESKKP
jgi:modulator of FtsH protease HflK